MPSDTVLIKVAIRTDDGDLFDKSLSYKQTIERVFMVKRHPDQQGCVRR